MAIEIAATCAEIVVVTVLLAVGTLILLIGVGATADRNYDLTGGPGPIVGVFAILLGLVWIVGTVAFGISLLS